MKISFVPKVLDRLVPTRLFSRLTIARKMLLGYMTLVTLTRSPPSCAAMLPQKFSAATTTSLPADVPGVPVEHAAGATRASAVANAATPTGRTRRRPRRPVRALICSLVGVALVVKVAAFAVVMRAENVLVWLTPGGQYGLLLGLAVALFAVRLPRTVRLAVAAVLLMAATVLVNLAPPNPYLVATLKLWQQGHFLNFNGLTRLVSALWVFAALAYLIYLAARRRDAPDS